MDLKLTPRTLVRRGDRRPVVDLVPARLRAWRALRQAVAAIASWRRCTWFAARVSQHAGRHVTAFDVHGDHHRVRAGADGLRTLGAPQREPRAVPVRLPPPTKGASSCRRGCKACRCSDAGKAIFRRRSFARLDPADQRDGVSGAWRNRSGSSRLGTLLILVFTILLLFFLYEQGESLARDFRRWPSPRDRSEQAECHVDGRHARRARVRE